MYACVWYPPIFNPPNVFLHYFAKIYFCKLFVFYGIAKWYIVTCKHPGHPINISNGWPNFTVAGHYILAMWNSLFCTLVDRFHPVIFEVLNKALICNAALHTHGVAGASGLYTFGYMYILSGSIWWSLLLFSFGYSYIGCMLIQMALLPWLLVT